jgi:hypothetical protein
MFVKFLYFLFFLKVKTVSCKPESKNYEIRKHKILVNKFSKNKLSKYLNECSGMYYFPDSKQLFAINDGGNAPELFELDSNFSVKTNKTLNITNQDWEALSGNYKKNTLYIGDIGNNLGKRNDLIIYGLDSLYLVKEKIFLNHQESSNVGTITKKHDLDLESMFFYDDSLYLFSKNAKTKKVNLYSVPSVSGSYTLVPKHTTSIKGKVTDACISPNASSYALLLYGKVMLYKISNGKIVFSEPLFCIKLPFKQAETITYTTENTLLVSNEQGELITIALNKY